MSFILTFPVVSGNSPLFKFMLDMMSGFKLATNYLNFLPRSGGGISIFKSNLDGVR